MAGSGLHMDDLPGLRSIGPIDYSKAHLQSQPPPHGR